MIGIFVIGIITSLDVVRSELIKNTTGNVLTLGANISENLDRRIDSTMMNLSTFVLNPQVLELINESNDEFDQIENISHYMNIKESEWRSYDDKENPIYDEMVNNQLSQKLETFRQVIKTSSNIDMFPEIYIVNKYGATIAENSRTSNWDQSNKLKFKNSKIYGSHIEDIHYDVSADIWALGVALAIYDDDDEFAGMIKTAYAIQDIHQLVVHAKNEANYDSMEVNVFTSDRRYIFSDGINAKTPGDNIDESFTYFEDNFLKEESGIVDVHGVNKLVVYTTSNGFRNFSGLGWIVTISIPEQDFLEPINKIQDILVVLLLISVGIAIIISIIMVRSIVIPILQIKNASEKLSDGDLTVKTEITSKDEIGELSASFDEMSKKLQESQIAINLREELIRQKDNLLLKFSDSSIQCCVCIIDIIQSTKTTANLTDTEINDFYGIFINAVNNTIKKFNGVTVKNLGDGLLFYFPKMSDSNVENYKGIDKNQNAKFHNVIQCCMDICRQNNAINKKMEEKSLHPVNYRISITYGSISIAKVSTSIVEDIFGATVNQCAKINHYAKSNGVVIGNSMYRKIRYFSQYVFEKIDEQSIGNEDIYSIFMDKSQIN